MVRWRTFTCGSCRGHGVVSGYAGDGEFIGPVDCDGCNMGEVYVSENDRLAEWPGGRFLGRWPGKFAEVGSQESVPLAPGAPR